MFKVGPESASAHPGPVCYRKGGYLAVTDANLLLGRLDPNFFPKIFGKSEKEPLDYQASKLAFEQMALQVNTFLKEQDSGKQMTVDEVAYGFIKVANESMCRPIRALTQGKGFNAADHILSCFGGAGGQHAFAIARSLGINMILVHRYSSLLSAYGLALADIVHEEQEPVATILDKKHMDQIKKSCQKLIESAKGALGKKGFPDDHISIELYLNLRYQGTDTAIMTCKPNDENNWDFTTVFLENYEKEFGFTLPNRDILVDDLRVRAIGKSVATGSEVKWTKVHQELLKLVKNPVGKPSHHSPVYWEGKGRVNTPFYILSHLKEGDEVTGPAVIIDNTATIAIEPNSHAVITSEHVVGYVGSTPNSVKSQEIVCDPIMLSVFGHRFMSIAEQMGRTLQKTSISTNIKERLDFSCALFGPDGNFLSGHC